MVHVFCEAQNSKPGQVLWNADAKNPGFMGYALWSAHGCLLALMVDALWQDDTCNPSSHGTCKLVGHAYYPALIVNLLCH